MVQWTSTQRGHKQLLNSSCPDDSHAKGSNNSFGGAEEKLKDERPRMLRKRDQRRPMPPNAPDARPTCALALTRPNGTAAR